MQQLRGRLEMRSRIEDSVCIRKRGRHNTKRDIWNGYVMTKKFLFGT